MSGFRNKTVLITGASSGIGLQTALAFAKDGANVILYARRAEKLSAVCDEIRAAGGSAIAVAGDVSSAQDLEKACSMGAERFGSLDILVNNAGVDDGHAAAVRCTDENWENNITINEKGVFLGCRAALQQMEKTGNGSIINISSIGGRYAVAGVAYSAAKYAVIGLTKNIAIQYAGTGIRCNCVCPGPVRTDMLKPPSPENTDMEMLELTGRHIDKSVPFLKPQDIVNAILFFADDASIRITGQCLVVDGGRCL